VEGRDEEVETRKLLLLRQTAAHGPPTIRITLLAARQSRDGAEGRGWPRRRSATAVEQELARWALAPKLVVDLAGVKFIDEAGIHVLRQRVGDRGCPARACSIRTGPAG